MKTKIIMMTALLALLAAGCGKEGDGRIRILAENMTAASNGSKVMINPDAPVNGEQWVAGETIIVNNSSPLAISGDDEHGYSVETYTGALVNNAIYAIYPGSNFGGNSVTIDNSNPATPTITLTTLDVDFVTGGHKVAFPMGAKADGETTSILFKHLTAGFQLTLNATSSVTMTNLKVIVYGNGPAAPVTNAVDGVSYTVAWAQQGPAVPVGPTGSITDRNVSYASEMNFNLKTNGTSGVTFTGAKKLCIPVTLATVNRITVIGYNGSNVVFSKTSEASGAQLVRNKIYPVAAIQVN